MAGAGGAGWRMASTGQRRCLANDVGTGRCPGPIPCARSVYVLHCCSPLLLSSYLGAQPCHERHDATTAWPTDTQPQADACIPNMVMHACGACLDEYDMHIHACMRTLLGDCTATARAQPWRAQPTPACWKAMHGVYVTRRKHHQTTRPVSRGPWARAAALLRSAVRATCHGWCGAAGASRP